MIGKLKDWKILKLEIVEGLVCEGWKVVRLEKEPQLYSKPRKSDFVNPK